MNQWCSELSKREFTKFCAAKVLLDFKYVAPFCNERDSKATRSKIEAKFRNYFAPSHPLNLGNGVAKRLRQFYQLSPSPNVLYSFVRAPLGRVEAKTENLRHTSEYRHRHVSVRQLFCN